MELRSGDLLLSVDESWVEVTGVRITSEPLLAYNLDVAEVDSFFVRGAAANDSDGVWVHNCDEIKMTGFGNSRRTKGDDDELRDAVANIGLDKEKLQCAECSLKESINSRKLENKRMRPDKTHLHRINKVEKPLLEKVQRRLRSLDE